MVVDVGFLRSLAKKKLNSNDKTQLVRECEVICRHIGVDFKVFFKISDKTALTKSDIKYLKRLSKMFLRIFDAIDKPYKTLYDAFGWFRYPSWEELGKKTPQEFFMSKKDFNRLVLLVNNKYVELKTGCFRWED